jgi:hypothetical protein
LQYEAVQTERVGNERKEHDQALSVHQEWKQAGTKSQRTHAQRGRYPCLQIENGLTAHAEKRRIKGHNDRYHKNSKHTTSYRPQYSHLQLRNVSGPTLPPRCSPEFLRLREPTWKPKPELERERQLEREREPEPERERERARERKRERARERKRERERAQEREPEPEREQERARALMLVRVDPGGVGRY